MNTRMVPVTEVRRNDEILLNGWRLRIIDVRPTSRNKDTGREQVAWQAVTPVNTTSQINLDIDSEVEVIVW